MPTGIHYNQAIGGGGGGGGTEYGYTTSANIPQQQQQQQQPHSQPQYYYQHNVPGGVTTTPPQQTGVGRRPTVLGRAPTRRMAPGANSIANAGHNIQRGRTLIRPDRYQEPPPLLTGKPTSGGGWFDPWVLFSRIVTFWAFAPMLAAMGKSDKGMQQAWREKMALCFIIACMGGFVAFITIGLSSVMCPPDQATNSANYASYNDTINSGKYIIIIIIVVVKEWWCVWSC